MRAARLLRILMLLQTRQTMTAEDLAARLEVSVRTVQRDMDELSGAGVPVYAVRGGGGGWRLIDGFKTNLTGLTPSEALAVAVARPDTVLRDIGLSDAGDLGMLKVLAALPDLAQQAARHARDRIHVDLEPWDGVDTSVIEVLRSLYQATSLDVVANIAYGPTDDRFDIEPLGLVAKGLVWYLIARRNGQLRTYRAARVHDVTVTETPVERRADFDLATHWRQVCQDLPSTYAIFNVTLKVRDAGLRRLRWTVGSLRSGASAEGWTHVDANLENHDEAVSTILSLGDDVIVEGPKSLRNDVIARAQGLLVSNTRHT